MRLTFGFSLVAALCLSSFVLAQEKRREERREERAAPAIRREAGDKAHAVGSADQQIAALLFGCARNEVEISKLAQDKATSEEVRNFAAMMVKDHTPGMEKMQHVAGPLASAHGAGTPAEAVKKEEGKENIKEETREKPRRDPAAKDSPVAAPREGRREGGETRVRAVVEAVAEARGNGAHPVDWVSIHKQIADQCLASAKAEFQKKDGAEFDHCYMGQQIMAHAVKLDELKVLRNYASAELRKDIDEATQMATHHLDEAKKIAERMKGAVERVSRKPKAE